MKLCISDFLRAAPVLAVVAAVLLIFPYKAVSFQAADLVGAKPFPVSFVSLTHQQEESAVLKAKTAWLDGSELRGRMTAHLPLIVLPETDNGPILGDESILPQVSSMPHIAWPKRPFTPSLAADKPQEIPLLPAEEPQRLFSRIQLLQLDMKGTKK